MSGKIVVLVTCIFLIGISISLTSAESMSVGSYFTRWDGVKVPLTEFDQSITDVPMGDDIYGLGYRYQMNGTGMRIVWKESIGGSDFNVLKRGDQYVTQTPLYMGFLDYSTKNYQISSPAQLSRASLNGNSIRYSDVFPGIDYEFTPKVSVSEETLKESIVIREGANIPSSPYATGDSYLIFITSLKLGNLSVSDGSEGKISNFDITNRLNLKDAYGEALMHMSENYAKSDFWRNESREYSVNESTAVFDNVTNKTTVAWNNYTKMVWSNYTEPVTANLYNRLIKVSSNEWYVLSGVKYNWIKDASRTGEIIVDPSWNWTVGTAPEWNDSKEDSKNVTWTDGPLQLGDASPYYTSGYYLSKNNSTSGGQILNITPTWVVDGLNWTQTSKADFDSGVKMNVSTIEVVNSIVLDREFSNDANTKLLFHLNETSGTSATDSSGNGNTGTLNSAYFTTAYIGNGAFLDGANDYISVPNSASLDITGSAITVEGMFYPTSFVNTPMLADMWYTSGTGAKFVMYINTTGHVYWLVNTTGGDSSFTSAAAVPLNNWTHIAGVYDGANIYVYINGTKDTNSAAKTGNLFASGKSLEMGAIYGGTSNQFAGKMDEIRISNVARYSMNFTPLEYPSFGNFTSPHLDLWQNQTFSKVYTNVTVYNDSTRRANITLTLNYSYDNATWYNYNESRYITTDGSYTDTWNLTNLTARYVNWSVTLQTNNSTTTPILHDVNISYEPAVWISANDGETWHLANNSNTTNTTEDANNTNLKFRINLSTHDTSQTPKFYNITLNYWIAPPPYRVVSQSSPACTAGVAYYSTIQEAIDAASNGDEIVVCAGTYNENLTVNKSVTLRANNTTYDVIVNSSSSSNDAITVSANNINISWLKVQNATASTKVGIDVSGADYANISNNWLTSNDYGIQLKNANNNNLTNNNASGNSNYGIHLYYSSNNNLTNNTANDNYNNVGISLNSSSNYNTLTNNNASSNLLFGIRLESSNYNNLTNNNASCNNHSGIFLSSSSNYNTLTNNNASSNLLFGIIIQYSSTSNTLTSNIANNNSYGIGVDQSTNNNLTNNNASGNSYGIVLASSNNNTLTNNIISSNYNTGIYIDTSENNTIYNNYISNTNNVSFGGTIYNNIWNTTKKAGTSIAGTPYLGGNYWAYPNGTGFSETCTNSDPDGICDSSYELASGNIDYLPLTTKWVAPNISIKLSGEFTYQKNNLSLKLLALVKNDDNKNRTPVSYATVKLSIYYPNETELWVDGETMNETKHLAGVYTWSRTLPSPDAIPFGVYAAYASVTYGNSATYDVVMFNREE